MGDQFYSGKSLQADGVMVAPLFLVQLVGVQIPVGLPFLESSTIYCGAFFGLSAVSESCLLV